MNEQRDFIRFCVISDLHCGHRVGLTPPDYQSAICGEKFHKTQIVLWNFYMEAIQAIQPIDVLCVNGDAIDGRGERSGSSELIAISRHKQCEMASVCIAIAEAKKVVMLRGCLTSGHRILTSDLRWVPVELLKVNDTLLAFDADMTGPTKKRWYRKSKVLCNSPIRADCARLYLSDGTTIEATLDHPFLVKRCGFYQWFTVMQLYKWMYHNGNGKRNKRKPIPFPRSLKVWDYKKDFETGYLGGFFDGEGSCSQRRRGRKSRSGMIETMFTINGYQRPGIVLDKVEKYLQQKGFEYGKYSGLKKGSDTETIQILGGIAEKLRFLGTIRPFRLLELFDCTKIGTFYNQYEDDTVIEKIELIGEQKVWGLSTSTGTYISEGFLSHNTPYHVGKLEEYEDIIADQVNALKIEDHAWYGINGVIFDVKHEPGGTSGVPHTVGTPIAMDKVWNIIWNDHNQEQPNADIIIRSHVHKFDFIGNDRWLGVYTPALQGMGSKFGQKRCRKLVTVGIVWFDIYKDGTYTWNWNIAEVQEQKAKTLTLS